MATMLNEFGILVLESETGSYQLLGQVSSIEEAQELMRNYLIVADPDTDLAPDYGVIRLRDQNGLYNRSIRMEF